ncbi:hypothetical protein LPB72_10245 [Hydrogenophaga crassostreae]|uniref:Uncharacterized protein n=1 Tax=Hydrogenophaga crassostreae TaxID=1763535 RepID=A0A162SYE5_9BURK|nr:hypothetical protein [Hydrogenophaga crassostreae]AOW13406.1 hypothetical protein LPB072_11625 [Hydrogenophaga crassostreae]OAD41691.1 hypothetical protein LPB72_10245 [Hydrogenophaga crassostreae]
MSNELVSFSEVRWSERCVQIAAEAARKCENSHDRYTVLFSEQVDLELATLPDAMRFKAIVQAQRWDYVSATQRAIVKLALPERSIT